MNKKYAFVKMLLLLKVHKQFLNGQFFGQPGKTWIDFYNSAKNFMSQPGKLLIILQCAKIVDVVGGGGGGGGIIVSFRLSSRWWTNAACVNFLPQKPVEHSSHHLTLFFRL
jgi:hypothetical protein